MKKRLMILTLGLAGSLSFGLFHAFAYFEVSAGVSINATADFYEPLTPYGNWVAVGSFGRCWRPTQVAVGWQPYCTGYWEWTDCGWYWVSDEPWAWACYHYGAWDYDPVFGWVWVPGVDWAPAWVEWRLGGGYIGWSPCAPPGVVVAPARFVFVEQGRFTERCTPGTVIVNNTTVINNTRILGNNSRREEINVEGRKQQVIFNEGPGVTSIERVTNRKLTAVPVHQADAQTAYPKQFRNHSPDQNRPQNPNQNVEQPRHTTSPADGANLEQKANPRPEMIPPGNPAQPMTPPSPPSGNQGHEKNNVIPQSPPAGHQGSPKQNTAPQTPPSGNQGGQKQNPPQQAPPSGNQGDQKQNGQGKDKDKDQGHDGNN